MSRWLKVALVGLTLGWTACAGAEDLVKLTNIGHGYYAAHLYIAQQAGLFTKHGLKADVTVVQGGPLALQTVLSKQVDVGILSYEHVLTAAVQGKRVVAVFNLANRPLNNIVIKTELATPGLDVDARIRRLNGLRVALPSAGGSGEKMLGVLARKVGLKLPGDISTVYLGSEPASYVAAFQRGLVDAALPVEPAGVLIQQAGVGKTYIDLMKGEVPEFRDLIFMTLSVHPDSLSEKTALLRRLVEVFREAAAFLKAEPARSMAILAKEFPSLSPAANEQAFAELSKIWTADGRMSEEEAKAVEAYLQPKGSVPVVFSQTFTNSLLSK